LRRDWYCYFISVLFLLPIEFGNLRSCITETKENIEYAFGEEEKCRMNKCERIFDDFIRDILHAATILMYNNVYLPIFKIEGEISILSAIVYICQKERGLFDVFFISTHRRDD